jgi:hypothetical protein
MRSVVARTNAGFTLIELAVMGAVATVILFGLLAIWDTGLSAYASGEAQACVNEDLRRGMRAIVGEITEAAADSMDGVPADGVWYPQLTFSLTPGSAAGLTGWNEDTITYYVGGTRRDQLMRKTAEDHRVIANNVRVFRVRRSPDNDQRLEIVLRAYKTTHLAPTVRGCLYMKVHLRN